MTYAEHRRQEWEALCRRNPMGERRQILADLLWLIALVIVVWFAASQRLTFLHKCEVFACVVLVSAPVFAFVWARRQRRQGGQP